MNAVLNSEFIIQYQPATIVFGDKRSAVRNELIAILGALFMCI